jgi:hypothetical protein
VLYESDQDELCEEARAFVKEAERRINQLQAEGRAQVTLRDYWEARILRHSVRLPSSSAQRRAGWPRNVRADLPRSR